MTIFTRGQAIAFIEKAFGEGKASNGGLNISVLCPECVAVKPSGYNKKKLVIRTDTFVTHCWVCGFKSRNLVPLLKKWNSSLLGEFAKTFLQGEQLTDIEQDEEEKLPEVVSLPQEFRLLALSECDQAVRARRYLASRGVSSEHDLWYWKFGIAYDNQDLENRVIIPSFDSSGALNYWTARAITKVNGTKYMNPAVDRTSIIFNEINIDWSKPLTLVEGPFDLLKCNENATCLLGSEFTPEYALFRKIVEYETPVVLAMDPDARAKALKIAKELSEYDVPVTMLWVSDEKDDVGAMTREEFRNLYSNGTLYDTRTYLLQKIRLLMGKTR